MSRKKKQKRTVGQKAAFQVSRTLHTMSGVAGMFEELNSRAGAGLAKLGDHAELIVGVASVIDRGESVEKRADEAAKAACDSAFGKEPKADEAEGENGEGAQAPA